MLFLIFVMEKYNSEVDIICIVLKCFLINWLILDEGYWGNLLRIFLDLVWFMYKLSEYDVFGMMISKSDRNKSILEWFIVFLYWF